ncbi:polysaccharide deacetylase family protein [Desmospora activa]|uniref:Putative sporulation protein (Polysaccharide deacetylase family) n=1 Tax=Desmospora activa DSM 45169 TaxID=1121389 RepID=A0A2T4ZAM9_9BACL|nr:polysaccharide deacetylase family protein [Desmospora activa]PTM58954.1 putative sporulation protein (polysaccharide deacetylase family) [Desmospora activa DSM 45169]
MENRLKMRWLLLAVPVVGLILFIPSVSAYVSAVKAGEAEPVFQQDQLRQWIEEEADRRDEPPRDARLDSIWKAIPDYEGITIDREATYQLAKKRGEKRPSHWIVKTVPSKVSLSDLGAQPIYRGNEQKPMAALMINVAWGTEHLPTMLEILQRERVKATFFLDGSWLKKHPKEALQLLEQGHQLGNHAYSHPLMSGMEAFKIKREIEKTEALIRDLGVRSQFFAPPAGDYDQQVVTIAHQLGMKTVLWTVDTVDWKKSSSPGWMVDRVKKGIGNGSLVLMHPTDRTVIALPKIISTIKEKGLKLGTVDEVLSSKRVEHVESVPGF